MDDSKLNKIVSLTWKKKIVFSIVTLALSFFVIEILFRLIFSFYVGPSVLLYGTSFDRKLMAPNYSELSSHPKTKPDASAYLYRMTEEEWLKRRNVEIPSNELVGYSKYFANQKRVDFDVETGERFDVTINSRGFRGRDFSEQKKPGVIRILCLGSSSTFGYFDRDDETYPVYLEKILNERSGDKVKFEVLNLGIPHLSSGEIYNLFLAEGVPLEPDIVTFYEGNNDCEPPQQWLHKSLVHAGIKKVGRVFVLAKFIDSISGKYLKFLYQDMSEQAVYDIRDNFIDNVSSINNKCKNRGIQFIIANQQKNSQSFDRDVLKTLTYQEEVEKINSKLIKSGALIHPELQLLIHSVLMKELEVWAKSNQIPFIDIIDKLNHNRDVLVSWVHLSPTGNRMVAEAFSEKILQYVHR